MRLRTLLIALAVTVGSGLVLPGQVEARHRHSRHCRHGAILDHRGPYWDAGFYGDYGPYGGYRYEHYDYPYRYDRYDYPYRYYRPYRHRHYHFHRGVRCYLPHLSIHIGW